ncbi:MAG: polysaccharide biosynthesis tyrosine autokinase [Bryobacteraceae bacterium]
MSEAFGNPPGSSSSGLLMEYWTMIRGRLRWILLAGLAGLAAAALYTLPQTPIYQSRASLKISAAQAGSTPDSQLQTQIKILQSESLIGKVVVKLKSQVKQGDPLQSGRVSTWRSSLGLPMMTREEALAFAGRNLIVRLAGTTSVVEIFCDSPDRQLSADFANLLAAEYIDQSKLIRTGDSAVDALAAQAEEAKRRVDASENRRREYESTGHEDASAGAVAGDQLRLLQSELLRARTEREQKQTKLAAITEMAPEKRADALDDATLRDLRAKVVDAQRELAEARAKLTPAHPKVQALQKKTGEAEAAATKQAGTIISRLREEYEAAALHEKRLTEDYDRQSQVVSGQGQKVSRLESLKREVEADRRTFDEAAQRLNQARSTSAAAGSVVEASMIDRAAPGGLPYKPNLPRNLAFGLASGLVLSAAAFVLLERTDRTFQTQGEAGKFLNLPELGAIPAVRMERATAPGKSGEFADRVELVTHVQRSSLVADSFRAAIASILFGQGERLKEQKSLVMVLTSSAPGEGKSTVASNLAVAMAETRRRVLLIDADLRKPRLHEIFGIAPDRGLSDVLESESDVAVGPSDAIRPSGIKGLDILPAGRELPEIANLLYSARFPELLASLRQTYDVIFIDTPPMLQMPDARVLSRLADGVVFVVRAGQTTREAALAASKRFAEDGTRVLGIILNCWDAKSKAGYGYGASYKNYYQGDK